MATITTSAPVWYNGGSIGASSILGYESGRNRVVRYQFTTPDTGISSLSFTIDGWMHYSGDTANSIKFYIGSSSTDHANAGASSPSTGTATFSPGDGLNGTISGSANIVLQPNTVYYLWLFPGGTNYYCWSNWSNKTAILNNVVGAASTFSLSATSVNVGSEITVTINANSSSFTHKLKFYINNTYSSEYTVASGTTTYTFAIPTLWYNAMPSTSSCTAYCQMTTHNNGTQIGNPASKSFVVRVGSDVQPSIEFNISVLSGNDEFILQSKDTLLLTAKGIAGQGSAVKSYVFTGPSLSKTITTTNSEASVSTTTISATGELVFKVTVIDTRNRSASAEQTITCYEYFTPYFKTFNAYRSNIDGEPDDEGIYIQFEYALEYASNVPGNEVDITPRGDFIDPEQTHSESGMRVRLTEDDAASRTYTVYLEATDSYGSSGRSSDSTIFGDTRILNITADGTGVAIGKLAESSNSFDVRWDSRFRGDVNIDHNITAANILQAVPLWSGQDSGTIAIDLSDGDDLDSYTYLEVYYADNNGKGHGYTKVYQPNGKELHLSLIEASQNTSYAGRTYIRRTSYGITGNGTKATITPYSAGQGYIMIKAPNESGDPLSFYLDANYISITKVVGYK